MTSRNILKDVATQLEDGAAATTASGVGQVGGSDAVIDLGAAANLPDNAHLEVDVTASDDGDGDEVYEVILQGSTDQAFTTPVDLATMDLPRGETGKFDKTVNNNRNGTKYQWLRLQKNVTGTSPSITMTSWLGKR